MITNPTRLIAEKRVSHILPTHRYSYSNGVEIYWAPFPGRVEVKPPPRSPMERSLELYVIGVDPFEIDKRNSNFILIPLDMGCKGTKKGGGKSKPRPKRKPTTKKK